MFGTTLGMLVYLSLIPSLAALHRPDLAAAAVACAVLCQWPLALSRWGSFPVDSGCASFRSWLGSAAASVNTER